eukprot:10841575-Karenia_brevis.AAC.1
MTNLAGMPGSSYRTELAGIILATYSPTPTHVALDNQAVQQKADQVLHSLLHPSPTSFNTKHFGLQRDGDLWQVFHDNLVQRGPHSFAVSWVKGHQKVTADMNEMQAYATKGNIKADSLATKAKTYMYPPHIRFVSSYLYQRHAAALDFYSSLHLVLVHVFTVARTLRLQNTRKDP